MIQRMSSLSRTPIGGRLGRLAPGLSHADRIPPLSENRGQTLECTGRNQMQPTGVSLSLLFKQGLVQQERDHPYVHDARIVLPRVLIVARDNNLAK